jgi:hypothetical protein
MTASVTTICSSVVKLACLAGLFYLAFVYDGAMLYLFAAVAGGVAGYDLGKFMPRRP